MRNWRQSIWRCHSAGRQSSSSRVPLEGFQLAAAQRRCFKAVARVESITGESTAESGIKCATDGYALSHCRKPVTIPALGFGTWGYGELDADTMATAVDSALRAGFRHLDCARIHENESEIGQVIGERLKDGTIASRRDLFITSKLWNHEHAPPPAAPQRALEDSLRRLGLDYVDCFMIQWPFRNSIHFPPLPFETQKWAFTLKCLNELVLQGLAKSVGVCNATAAKLKQLALFCGEWNMAVPSVNQVEMHPYLQQPELAEYCHATGIQVSAAMPLGSSRRPLRCRRDDDPLVLADEVIAAIGKEVGASPSQVIIRWHLNRGTVCVPQATEQWMIQENIDALAVQLSDKHMATINALDRHFRFERGQAFQWKENQQWSEFWDGEG